MSKLPTHHQLWVRASNSTRASMLVRRSAAATHHCHHHANRSRTYSTEVAATVAAVRQCAGVDQRIGGGDRHVETASYPEEGQASSAVIHRDAVGNGASSGPSVSRGPSRAPPRSIPWSVGPPAASAAIHRVPSTSARFSTAPSVRASTVQPSASRSSEYAYGSSSYAPRAEDVLFAVPRLEEQAGQLVVHGINSWEIVQPWDRASAVSSSAISQQNRADFIPSLDALSYSVETILQLPPRSSSQAVMLDGDVSGRSSGSSSSLEAELSGDAYHNFSGSSNHSSSSGGHGASGSGSSSSRPPAFHAESMASNGSPSPSPGPASSTTLHTQQSNSTPSPFPLTASKSERSSDLLPPLEPAGPSALQTRPYTLSHHSDAADLASPLYEFRHGAYGIPKRHPLAITGSGKSKRSTKPAPPKGTRGMLAAAADFLAGPQTPPEPPPRPPPPKTTEAGPWKKLEPDTLRSVQVGEDAYFLRPDSLGVADGVGGWATRPGANPAMFSRLLMHFCSVELSRYDHLHDQPASRNNEVDFNNFWSVDPVEVMQRAWERCVRVARREGILGSSTALLAMLRGDELRIANLGDCVLLIVREGELLFRSQEQQHSFNFPVQLGMMIKRGTKDVEDLFRNLNDGSKAANEADEREAAQEDYDAVEDEAKANEHGKRLEKVAAKALGISTDVEAEEKKAEREGLRRRAEFEGKSAAEFEAEMKAAEEFDFDVNNPGSKSSSPSTRDDASANKQQAQEDDDRQTVYVGFDDNHPWDEPRRDCGRWTIQVQKGDIIIVASDGLVDNLFDEDIVEEVQRFAPPPEDLHDEHEEHEHEDDEERHSYPSDSGISLDHDSHHHHHHHHRHQSSTPYPPASFSPQLLSEALCSRAKALSQDSKAIISPFQQRATEEGLHYVGGKHDDITVLCAVIDFSTVEGEDKLVMRGGR